MSLRLRSARCALNAAVGLVIGALAVSVAPSAMAAAPSEPQDISVIPASGSLLINWSAPANDGGSPITGYTMEIYDAASGGTLVDSCSPASLSNLTCTMTGLTNGTTYYLTGYATNADGTSTPTARTAETVGGPASAPLRVVAAREKQSVLVAWEAPSHDGGLQVTNYVARAYTSLASSAPVAGSCTATGLTCDIGGLDDSTTYYVDVAAVTSLMEGTPSARVRVAAAASPTSPRNVKVVRGNGFAAVTWTAPLSFGGAREIRYVVRAYLTPTGGEPFVTCTPKVAKPRECDIGPLPNGTTYYIDVLASNALLDGTPTEPRIAVIPAAPPDAPRSVSAVQVGPEVRVAWLVPLSDGGLPISFYRATAHSAPTGGKVMGSCTTSGDQCSIEGLEDAPVYVDVIAETGAGVSRPSSPRVQVLLVDPPDAPQAVAVSPQGRTMRITWQPPNDDGRTPIASYTATVRDATGQTEVGACPVYAASVRNDAAAAGSQRRIGCTVTGLVIGSTYTVSVRATTVSGTYASSSPFQLVLEPRKPMTPRDVRLLPGDDSVTAVWTLPASDGGNPISSYVVQAWSKETGGRKLAECSAEADADASVSSCTLGGLDNFEPYWFAAAAVSKVGRGAFSVRQDREPQPSTPSAPLGVQLEERDGAIKVSWRSPWSDGGYVIRDYVVRSYAEKPTSTTTTTTPTTSVAVSTAPASVRTIVDECTVEAPTTSCTLEGFKEAQHTWVEVVAVNTVGEGTPSDPIDTTIVANRPAAPANVAASLSKRSVKVGWDAVPTSGAVELMGYAATVWSEEMDGGWVGQCLTTTETTCTVEVGKVKGPFFVSVRARNSLGWGDTSSPRTGVSPG